MPAHQGVRLEHGKCVETARPEAVEPDPEEALLASTLDPFRLSACDHRQLLAKRKDFEVEFGPASEKADDGG